MTVTFSIGIVVNNDGFTEKMLWLENRFSIHHFVCWYWFGLSVAGVQGLSGLARRCQDKDWRFSALLWQLVARLSPIPQAGPAALHCQPFCQLRSSGCRSHPPWVTLSSIIERKQKWRNKENYDVQVNRVCDGALGRLGVQRVAGAAG